MKTKEGGYSHPLLHCALQNIAMFYKLSNRANREQIEEEFEAQFKYPGIYSAHNVIDGLRESTLSIITSNKPSTIVPSIWGILPSNFSDDWKVFQKFMNTLNIPDDAIDSESWYSKAFESRRCLLLVTGYYTYFVSEGALYPFLISHASGKPFCLAGIYNQLEDGFLTTSLITVKANDAIREIHNLSDQMPLTVPKRWRKRWLDKTIPLNEIRCMMKTPLINEFKAIPVPKRVLEPSDLNYENNASFIDKSLPIPKALKQLLFNHNITLGNQFENGFNHGP